jgi:hypothetical protein
VSDTDANCNNNEAYLSRCKKINTPVRACAPKSFSGTVTCCADGVNTAPEGTDLTGGSGGGGAEARSVCGESICGATCAEIEGCGWSTNKNKCVPGGRTSLEEMGMGVCLESDLAATCGRHVCGDDCADDASGECTWSRKQARCVKGDPSTTSNNERRMGDCPLARDFASEELVLRKECKDKNCA